MSKMERNIRLTTDQYFRPPQMTMWCVTRMHSSRMHTARLRIVRGGGGGGRFATRAVKITHITHRKNYNTKNLNPKITRLTMEWNLMIRGAPAQQISNSIHGLLELSGVRNLTFHKVSIISVWVSGILGVIAYDHKCHRSYFPLFVWMSGVSGVSWYNYNCTLTKADNFTLNDFILFQSLQQRIHILNLILLEEGVSISSLLFIINVM